MMAAPKGCHPFRERLVNMLCGPGINILSPRFALDCIEVVFVEVKLGTHGQVGDDVCHHSGKLISVAIS